VDIPFPEKVRDEIIAAGRAEPCLRAHVEPHHVLPRLSFKQIKGKAGWISFYLNEPADIEQAIALLRQSFE
jgi:hypothetical protein